MVRDKLVVVQLVVESESLARRGVMMIAPDGKPDNALLLDGVCVWVARSSQCPVVAVVL